MYAQYFVNNIPITTKIKIGTYQIFVEQYPSTDIMQPRTTDIHIASSLYDSIYHDLQAMRMALIGDLKIFNNITNYISVFRKVKIVSYDIQTFDMYSNNLSNQVALMVWRGFNCNMKINNTIEPEVDWIHEGF
jgi:hypothetical protein